MIFSNSAISHCSCLNSAFNSLTSVFVKRYKRITTMASACFSVKSKRSIKFFLAWALSFDLRMIRMISSITLTALIKPSNMCARSFLEAKSYLLLRITTSSLWLIKASNIMANDICTGTLFTIAMTL